MQEILALSLQAMHVDMQRLDQVGINLANGLTPGYKRSVVASSALSMIGTSFESTVDKMRVGTMVNGQSTYTALSPRLIIQSDVRPGTLKSTGQSLDVALAGPGYFEVMTTDAGLAYTRQGNFRIDARGRLVTASGLPVMGNGGEIYLNGHNPVIDINGNVYESQETTSRPYGSLRGGVATGNGVGDSLAVAQLKVVQIDDAKNAQRLGDGLISGVSNVNVMKTADIQIRQGFLENSNVNSMQEMVQLMQTMRHFESMQKMTLGYDEMLGQAVRKLGELS